ncbi:hypothetical protein AMATHDRAFT_54135 [Amanita thiersii Skay4041]|uniref:Uncharacterized protein n=1 Tax=Amanita thiersii Skay4041 TaxID=703135 RepID=A0A2A9NRT9_9AGAR|nr:hypothetical protein AMATHDRAFT_54135 [Amanita thiersii Skay4041]
MVCHIQTTSTKLALKSGPSNFIGMGASRNKTSDLFYPDNRNRRARAREIWEDIHFFCNQYEEVKQKRGKILAQTEPKLSTLMKEHGYNSPEELDEAVNEILKDKALGGYLTIKNRVDLLDGIVVAIFQITTMMGGATGILLSFLVSLSITSTTTALAKISAIGFVLAMVTIITTLFDIWAGEQERENMRWCINELSIARVKARTLFEAMSATCNLAYYISLLLDDSSVRGKASETLMVKKLQGDFKDDFTNATRFHVVKYLEEYDNNRNSWIYEDPEWKSGLEPSSPTLSHHLDSIDLDKGPHGAEKMQTKKTLKKRARTKWRTRKCAYATILP